MYKRQGISELVDAIDKHQAFIRQQDNWSDYRYSMAKKQVESIVKSMTYNDLLEKLDNQSITEKMIENVSAKNIDPISAAKEIIQKLN